MNYQFKQNYNPEKYQKIIEYIPSLFRITEYMTKTHPITPEEDLEENKFSIENSLKILEKGYPDLFRVVTSEKIDKTELRSQSDCSEDEEYIPENILELPEEISEIYTESELESNSDSESSASDFSDFSE